MRTIVGYEGEGRLRRAVWSASTPGFAAHSHRPSGQLVVGTSERQQHRIDVKANKARRKAFAA